MIYVDADAVAAAGERVGCRSAESFRKKFGGGHDTWKSLLTGAPVQKRVFEFVCEKLDLDPLEVEIHPLLKKADIARGLKLSMSSPTVVDFRSQFDARPDAAWPGGRGKATVEDPENRLFLLFSYLELHAASKETDIFIQSVRMLVEVGGLTQLFHPYRWCTISGANTDSTNPKGYWLAERMSLPAGMTADDPETSHLRNHGPEGFRLGKHGPISIKEECSFVAISRGELPVYRVLLDLLMNAGMMGAFKCTLVVKFRHGGDQNLRLVGADISFPLEHLQKSKAACEKRYGYAATLPAFANV
jgi:hypothetical protein